LENQKSTKKTKKRYYRKKTDFFNLIKKLKLWPSRNGVLHGIKNIDIKGDTAEITTHCGETFIIKNSKNCRIPEWKLEKYNSSVFN
jgi:intein-encoded DNA endonuclease-like protein